MKIIFSKMVELNQIILSSPQCPVCKKYYSIRMLNLCRGLEKQEMTKIAKELGSSLFLVLKCKSCKKAELIY